MPKGILTSAVVYEYHANSFGKQVCLHYAMSEQYIVAEASTQRRLWPQPHIDQWGAFATVTTTTRTSTYLFLSRNMLTWQSFICSLQGSSFKTGRAGIVIVGGIYLSTPNKRGHIWKSKQSNDNMDFVTPTCRHTHPLMKLVGSMSMYE